MNLYKNALIPKVNPAISMNHQKASALVIFAILASGLLATPSASASKPSVPQFTVGTADDGEIIIMIENQPTGDANKALYYQVRTGDSNSNDWKVIEIYRIEKSGYWSREPYQKASSGQYTTLSINTETKREFQVQALIGNLTGYNDHELDLFHALTTYIFHGESSDWSPPQSANGKIYTPQPTPQPTTPTAPQLATPTINPPQPPTATPQATYLPQDNQIDNAIDVDWNTIALTVMAVAIAILGVAIIGLWRRLPKRAD
jgi:hypothetical protein